MYFNVTRLLKLFYFLFFNNIARYFYRLKKKKFNFRTIITQRNFTIQSFPRVTYEG